MNDGYTLSRVFWDFAFENPEKISPNHAAIFFFAIEHCNRLGWKEKFGFPSKMVMDAIGIKNYSTYIRYFRDLVDWGFFELIQESKNQYSSNIIRLKSALPKNSKALDKAIVKHLAKHTEKQDDYNKTIEPLNQEPKNIKGQTAPVSAKDKIKYAEAVSMTPADYEKLIKAHGPELTRRCIEKLNAYKISKGKRYKSDYGAIISWVLDDQKKAMTTPKANTSPFS